MTKEAQAFWRELFREWAEWDFSDIDGEDLQNLAAKHGLIEMVPYDPKKHGPSEWGLEPGDDWYQLSEVGKAEPS